MIRSTAKFQTQRAGMTVMACTLAIMLAPSVTAAFPNRLVQDRTWAQSAQWLPLRVNRGPGFQTLTIDLNPTLMSCDDPLQRPALGPHPICGSFDSTFVDVWIHVFSATTGLEVMAPIHRTPPAPLPPGPGIRHFATAQLALPRGDFALMVHGGVDARGIISVSMAVRPGAAQAGLPLGDWNDVRFSDNLMFDVANRPEPFVVESVLVPDGPAAIDQDTGVVLPNSRGNDPNDWMGVDGTEVWLMEPVRTCTEIT